MKTETSLRRVAAAACLVISSLAWAGLEVKPEALSIAVGNSATATVREARGTVSVRSESVAVATASYANGVVTVKGVSVGRTRVNVSDREDTKRISVTVTTGTGGGGGSPPPPGGAHVVLAANDLGMHCTDQDFQIFSILPPFNSMHAQVVLKGSSSTLPRLLAGHEADVYYAAASSASDPAGAGSINTTGQNRSGVFKTNFWDLFVLPSGERRTYGSMAYRSLYPGVDKLGACDPATGPCPSVLDVFSPIPADLGLPVPDPNALPSLVAHQQANPAAVSLQPFAAQPFIANVPQPFARFDDDLAFFAGFPFGGIMTGVKWFSADGVPLLPVDDQGRRNAYPLMRVTAVSQGGAPGAPLAATDIVVPVASEADCQNCHADPLDAGNGRATSFASVATYADGTTQWKIARIGDAPGPEKLLNAAKINILRLHDAKHGAAYTSSADGRATPCRNGTETACLDKRRFIQCSQCHYSPALDLAQAGPVTETSQGDHGRQQTRHISMSRAMHFSHGQQADLFPAMPAPGSAARTSAKVQEVLTETCYQCHPGKQTQCLRGAMASGGVVCQDCHGDMKQVGNDFTGGFPSGGGADLAKRVPWAMEPKCQSCHVGDANTVRSLNRSDMIVARDGIRLAQAYRVSDAGAAVLPMIEMPGSRFGENRSLYRLSTGHGGVMCKGCHGSTHAEWPNANPLANDNVTAVQLQGHTGTITECNVCHAPGSLGVNLNGPHGMHPVNDPRFGEGHESLAERNPGACRACHGQRGEGTVLSRVAADRVLKSDRTQPDGSKNYRITKGTPVRCDSCHENKL